MSHEKIVVVCATNDRYARSCGVMLTSVLHNTPEPSGIDIFVLTSAPLSAHHEARLQHICRRDGATLNVVSMQGEYLNGLPTFGYLTVDAYLRLFFPDQFPQIPKFLYLDCDLVVKRDVRELFAVALGQYPVGAVHDIWAREYMTWAGIPDEDCFNSGVLLVNALKFKEQNIAQRVINFVRTHESQVTCANQDGLNAVLWRNWLRLPTKWNATTAYFHPSRKPADIAETRRVAAILHYTGVGKPDDYFMVDSFRAPFYRYLLASPWRMDLFRLMGSQLGSFARNRTSRMFRRVVKAS